MPLLQDYHDWIKIADAALPQNFIGYLISLCLEPFRAEPFTLLPYDNLKELAKCEQLGAKSLLLNPLPERDGLRPEISRWIAPSRQVTQFSGEDIHQVSTPHVIAKATKREIAHVHSGDHSLHICLSPADCKEAIGKAWGERMSLAGTFVPHEYLLIYTPRTVEEVAVVKDIVEGAILFMTGVERRVGA